MCVIDFTEVRVLADSKKSTVQLVREKGGERLFVRKRLKGAQPVYALLQGFAHPYLPKVYEVRTVDNETIVMEEFINGITLGSARLGEKQLRAAARELCEVLRYLHGKGIVHRDIKPSNIMLAYDGHIRLIDFDAARLMKDNSERDTELLGTRGYAPPEQYGFAQTDARADIFSFGVMFEQLLGKNARKPRYKSVIAKCKDPNPDKRYSSARYLKLALLLPFRKQFAIAVAALAALLLWASLYHPTVPENDTSSYLPVELSNTEKQELNAFLSSFIEVHFWEYETNYTEETKVVSFAYLHVLLHNPGYSRIEETGALIYEAIDGKHITATIRRFFGSEIELGSYGSYIYRDGALYYPAGDGEHYGYFTQLSSVSDRGDGTYFVQFDIYEVEYGDFVTYDMFAPVSTWTAALSNSAWKTAASGYAVVRLVSDGESGYNLVKLHAAYS